MHSSLLTDTESNLDAEYDHDFGYLKQIRVSSPQCPFSHTSYSSASLSFSGASISSRYQRNYGRANSGERKLGLYGSGYDAEEGHEMDWSDEGYDSYDASPRFQTRSSCRVRSVSPRRSSFSAHSTPLPPCPSPSFASITSSCPYPWSLPHPEELEDVDELPSDSNSIEELERNYTPSCNDALRRQWLTLALRVRFGVFRARRRMQALVGKGGKC